jgi:hypothetical protein
MAIHLYLRRASPLHLINDTSASWTLFPLLSHRLANEVITVCHSEWYLNPTACSDTTRRVWPTWGFRQVVIAQVKRRYNDTISETQMMIWGRRFWFTEGQKELGSLSILDGNVCLLYFCIVVDFQQSSSACISSSLSLLNFWICVEAWQFHFPKIAQGVFWTRKS